jgi:NADH-quinone oxidoreductase subunit M
MLTAFLIFWPLIVALLLFMFRPQQAKVWALVATLVELVASLAVVALFDKTGGTQFGLDVPWVASLGISFAVGIDGISLLLVLLTTVLVPFIVLSSFSNSYDKPHTFYGLILIMQMALVGVFTALDGFLFYIFWEMALIPIYFICLIWGGENRAGVTFKFFIYTLAGSLVMLVGLLYLYNHTPAGAHTFDLQALYDAGRTLSRTEQGWVFWAFFLAFAIKMPVFPFHTWQPDTYTEAPTQGTMLLSGIMLKMGIYGVIRYLIPLVPLGVQSWGFTALILSVIGIVYASCIAIVQKDFKRLIAYSSIAHVGLIAAGVLTLSKIGIQGAVVQMLSHGIIVFAMFYLVDIVAQRTRTRTLSELGGIRNVAPITATVLLVVTLGSVSLPFTSGFVGEFLLINSLVQYQPVTAAAASSIGLVIAAIAGLTTILGAVYMLRMYQRTMLGEVSARATDFIDLTLHEKIVLYPIVVMIVVMGVYPAPLLALSEPAVNNLVQLISDFTASVK